MTEFGNILIGGIVDGAIYALLALGFSLVFNVTTVLALAQGAFVTMGALTMNSFMVSAHLPIAVAFIATLAVILTVTGIVEWVIIRPALGRISYTNLLILMAGLLTAFEGGAFLIWGSIPYTLRQFIPGKPFDVGGVSIASQDIWVLATMIVCVGLLWVFLTRTTIGRGMRATAENMDAARLMGVSVDRTILFSFLISALLGAIAGVVIAPLTSLDFTSMAGFTTEGLIAVTLGGLGSLFGSVTGGMVLGVMDALLSGYVSSTFGTAFGLILLILLLIVRPQGLLGKIRGARADIAARLIGKEHMPIQLPRWLSRSGMLAVGIVMLGLPSFLSQSKYFTTFNIVGIFCLAIVGLELLTGIAGQVSLGQAGFMAIGGYTSAILVIHYHVTWILGLLAGIALSIAAATLLGLAGSRVRGMYMAIVTLAFGIFVEAVGNGLGITGGPSGLYGIPSFSIGGYSFDTETRFYYLIWGLVAVALILTGNLIRSSRGRIFRVMHEDDVGARSLGLDTRRAKVIVFVLSAVLGSIAGTLYAGYFHYFSPGMVGSAVSLEMITMLVVGGSGTQLGPLVGVALLMFLPDVSQRIANDALVIDGALLVLALRFLPSGLYGGFNQLMLWGTRSFSRYRNYMSNALLKPGSTAVVSSGDEAEITGNTVIPSRSNHSTVSFNEGVEVPEHAESKPNRIVRGSLNTIATNVDALQVEGLSKSFGGVQAVQGVSFEVAEGSIAALIGPNGAGKSTVFNLVTSIYAPDAGNVQLWGREIRGRTPDQIVAAGLFRTFQTSRIFRRLTVLENVLVGGYILSQNSYFAQALWMRNVQRKEKELVRRALAILDAVGLSDRANDPAFTLPLAGQKYLDLARALMSGARLLLLDEPGAGMNDAETAELGAMLLAIRDVGHTILVVDHNMDLVMGVADEVTVMDAGKVIANGTPDQIQRNESVIVAYFGRKEVRA